MTLCLHGAVDQGETAEEMTANEAEREEGKEKQGHLKIVEILKDHLKSHAWL